MRDRGTERGKQRAGVSELHAALDLEEVEGGTRTGDSGVSGSPLGAGAHPPTQESQSG